MFVKVAIIPTGDELKNGIILDTDSPMVMEAILSINGSSRVDRFSPVEDIENSITDQIKTCEKDNYDLIILIGGSGGGHRYSDTLGKDYTHSSLEGMLIDKHIAMMYGKNGHMWCKLICGRVNNALVINLPGPFDEAKAAIDAFKNAYLDNESDLESINSAMMEAVKEKYGN